MNNISEKSSSAEQRMSCFINYFIYTLSPGSVSDPPLEKNNFHIKSLSPHSGVTAVLTLSAISMDSRSDLPKVQYATALDWFIICSFLYCMATILEFAGVHYFTKVGSGETFGSDTGAEAEEIPSDDDNLEADDEWEDLDDWRMESGVTSSSSRINQLGPVLDPLNHNCVSVYNKR